MHLLQLRLRVEVDVALEEFVQQLLKVTNDKNCNNYLFNQIEYHYSSGGHKCLHD